ncbi:MAG: protein arginine kinase [bacterium]|nr:protein arginine kinase [bacterium]
MSYLPIDVCALASHVGAWLSSEGPESDVVVSCRVRLARNVEGYPFIACLEPGQAVELSDRLRQGLFEARIDGETWWQPLAEAGSVLRLLLHERNLVSREMAPTEGGQIPPGRAVAFGKTETVSVMVNEEDHVRLQAMAAGFDLDLAWHRAQVLDRYLEQQVPYAHTKQLGYLTGCPTNVGTGLRASVMLHLPALSMVRSELEKVFTAAQRTGLAVRGMHGEGSRAAGDLYQISNQVTLGRSESQLIDDLRALVPCIVEFERKLRTALLDEQLTPLKDRISRSLGMLRTARAMPTDGALAHLSNLRLGLHMQLVDAASIDTLNELGVQVQRGHIQALTQGEIGEELLEVSTRDKLRASYLRSRLGTE